MAPKPSSERFLCSDPDTIKHELTMKALGDRYRLHILALLKAHKGEISVEELTALVGEIDQSTITYHLKRLRIAGLVDSRKVARRVYYFSIADKLTETSNAIRDLTPGVKTGKKSA